MGDSYIASEMFLLALTEDKGEAGRLAKDAGLARKPLEAAIDAQGKLYLWGNENLSDIKVKRDYRETAVKKVTTNVNNYWKFTKTFSKIYDGLY